MRSSLQCLANASEMGLKAHASNNEDCRQGYPPKIVRAADLVEVGTQGISSLLQM